MKKVAVVDCASYEENEVYRALEKALQSIDFQFPENKTVLIKPNIMSQNAPEQHTITNYALVEALCRILQAKNCKIQIGEAIAFYQKGLTRKAFQTSKIAEVAKRYDAALVAFDEEPLEEISENVEGLENLFVPKILLEADLIVNLCKLKTHGELRLSGALKNIFGCLPGGYKQKIHRWVRNDFELSEVFIDLHTVLKPCLSIMDAVVSLDGGPTAIGRPVKTSKILASTSAAALDLAACQLIGYQPDEITTLICARKRHLIDSFEDLELIGQIQTVPFRHLVKGDFEMGREKDSIFIKDTYVNLKVHRKKCIQCFKCVDLCPVGAVKKTSSAPQIDTERCINCYVCFTNCPSKAIGIKPSRLNKIIRLVRWLSKV